MNYVKTGVEIARTLHLTVAVTRQSEDCYVAKCLEIDMVSQGKTVEMAIDNLRDALEMLYEGQQDVEDPPAPIIESIKAGVTQKSGVDSE